MREGRLTLVGAQVIYLPTLGTYRLDNVYREAGREGLNGIVVQRGFNLVLQAPILHIVNAVGDVYATKVIKIWVMRNSLIRRWYYQMEKGVTPAFVFINERWRLWAER